MARPEVLHIGPDPQFPGGIASVMTVLQQNEVGGRSAIVASWRPGGPRHLLLAFVQAVATVIRAPRRTLIHGHMAADGSIIRKGLILAAAKASGHRTVATLHGSRFAASAAKRPWTTKRAVGLADLVLVLSPEMLGIVRTLVPGANVHLSPNPVEVADAPTAAGDQPPEALFGGEVGERKGADVLLAAWPAVRAAVPDARLTIAGPPTSLELPELPGVTVLGPVPRAQVGELLSRARLVVLPSRAEALPMILLEAMGTARPFVATEVGDVNRLATTGGGVMVPIGDPTALAEALIAFLKDPVLATESGNAGYAACKEQFSVGAMARLTDAEYAKIRRS